MYIFNLFKIDHWWGLICQSAIWVWWKRQPLWSYLAVWAISLFRKGWPPTKRFNLQKGFLWWSMQWFKIFGGWCCLPPINPINLNFNRGLSFTAISLCWKITEDRLKKNPRKAKAFQGFEMVSGTGFEPVTQWLKVTCSTNWANRPHDLREIRRNDAMMQALKCLHSIIF